MAGTAPARWGRVLGPREVIALQGYRRSRTERPAFERPALVVIDVVPTFLGPDVPVTEAQRTSRQACGEFGWAAMPDIEALVTAFRSRSAPVIFTVVANEQASLARPGRTTEPSAGSRPEAALRGDVVVETLRPRPDELVLPKTRSSAFFGTPLLTALVRSGIRTVVLAGCTTSGCVLATAIDASSYGFDVVVADDACFDRVGTLHDAALVAMDAKWAWVLNARDVRVGLDEP